MPARTSLLLLIPLLWPAAALAQDRPICENEYGWCPVREGVAENADCSCLLDDRAVRGSVVEASEPNPLAELEPDAGELRRSLLPLGTFASRGFAGPTQLPPADFKAYGVVVFKTRASRFDRDRHLMICEAYLSALPHSSEIAVGHEQQMVTIWPIARDAIADGINSPGLDGSAVCETAVENYGLVHAQNALHLLGEYREAEGEYDTSGRGPFLVAWTPGAAIGEPESVALLVDLSHVEQPQEALRMLTLWRNRVQDNPELWEGEADEATLVEVIRRFFDRQGVVLEALGSL